MLLGEVSGSALIAVPEGLPMYRDLVDGATGPDVTALQAMLEQLGPDVPATGEVGPRTLDAVEALHGRLGAQVADPSIIRWTGFQPVPMGSTVVTSAAVGTVLTEELPLLTIRTAPDAIAARATTLEADEFVVGGTVQVRTPERSADSIVLSISDFDEFEDGSGSGRVITVQAPEGLVLEGSEPISISTSRDSTPGPAVPLVALRQDDRGTYVELALRTAGPSNRPGDMAERERVYVTVLAQADGWAAIADGGRPIGAKVLVSP